MANLEGKIRVFDKLEQEAILAEKETELQRLAEDVEHYKAVAQQMSRENKKLLKIHGAARALANDVKLAVKAVSPLPLAKVAISKPSSTPIEAVIDLSDLHIGEVIDPGETEGFGSFNWEIAQKRLLDEFAENFINWIYTQRKGYYIPRLSVFGIGDYISGDIHEELKVTNEFPLPMQTAKAGYLIGDFLAKLAPHFEHITFYGIGADNHSRLVRKPQAKQKAKNSMSFLVHEIAEQRVSRHSNIEFIKAEGMKYLATVNNNRILIEHGDTIKAVMGIPFYGFERFVGREAVRRMGSLGKEFDFVNIGHWHVPNIIGKVLVNGSLSGTSEYDHSAGRYALPSQVSYLLHPKHGMFNWVAWKFRSGLEHVNKER